MAFLEELGQSEMYRNLSKWDKSLLHLILAFEPLNSQDLIDLIC